jgi:hypothetical protein
MWDDLTTSAGASGRGDAADDGGWVADERVLEELRLEPETYLAVRDRALLRLLAGREAGRRRHTVDADTRRDLLGRLRVRYGLFTRAALDRWLEANAIDGRKLERIVEHEAQREAIGALAAPALPAHLLDELRLRNQFARLAARARDKEEFLESLGMEHPAADGLRLAPPTAVRAWFFERRLGQPLPDDIETAAREFGFADGADFDRALRREWLYTRSKQA